jgi:hypothetical protein
MTLGVASQTARAVPSGRGSDLGLDEHPGALSQVVVTSSEVGVDEVAAPPNKSRQADLTKCPIR